MSTHPKFKISKENKYFTSIPLGDLLVTSLVLEMGIRFDICHSSSSSRVTDCVCKTSLEQDPSRRPQTGILIRCLSIVDNVYWKRIIYISLYIEYIYIYIYIWKLSRDDSGMVQNIFRNLFGPEHNLVEVMLVQHCPSMYCIFIFWNPKFSVFLRK